MPKEESVKKKKWARPKLIILTRGKPEEGVLGACKGPEATTGQDHYRGGCAYAVDVFWCADCSSTDPS